MRNFPDWLSAYMEYAAFTESPRKLHFWAGVSAISGALRRRVWIDQKHFEWVPNHYIVFVAPPGVVSKTTTAAIAIDLLKQVPGINFGPHVVTWQALVEAFGKCTEAFEYQGDFIPMSALTLESGEFGNLIDPKDPRVIDLFVSLWDCKKDVFHKLTKGSGEDHVANPWINLIGCTTPAWIAGNFPEYVIGGGFTSRCLFIYADKKERYIAYPADHVPPGFADLRAKLISDLHHIATELIGEYILTNEAKALGDAWYQDHCKRNIEELGDERMAVYYARKQQHIHKLAMVLAASHSDQLIIDEHDFANAVHALDSIEPDMLKVFSRIGRTDQSIQAERLVQFINSNGPVTYQRAYAHVHSSFPNSQQFQHVIEGLVEAGLVEKVIAVNGVFFRRIQPK